MSDNEVMPVLLKLRRLGLVDFDGNLTSRGRELIREYGMLLHEIVNADFFS